MSISFSALLLAGGQSQRMGRDKASLEIDGEPLWRRQLTLLESLAPERIFIAAPVHSEWLRPACEFVTDARPEAGPLAGLVAGLRVSTSQFLLALAVDLPSMSANFLHDLLGQTAPGKGVIPVIDRFEPLAAIYPTAALTLAEEQLAGDHFALQELATHCLQRGLISRRKILPEEVSLFLNLNTPADLFSATNS